MATTMTITLTPIRYHLPLEAVRKGDVLMLNGTPCDLAKGETSDWLLGTAEKTAGGWNVTLILPHGGNAPPETLYPQTIRIETDGPIPCPPTTASRSPCRPTPGEDRGRRPA